MLPEELKQYKMIRQPYRITMAKWDFTAVQKRILTKVISMLQKEISLVATGTQVGQLEIFAESNESIKLIFLLKDIVKNENNHSRVKDALQELRNLNVQIILPATNSRKSKQPEQETILTGLIERAVLTKYSRTVSIIIHRATAQELVKTANGLTKYAEDIMYLTNSTYTQKLYELISHWKDLSAYTITPDKFREHFFLTDKYPQIKDLIRRVIKPAEKELKEIADIYFVFKPTIKSGRITLFNFEIIHKQQLYEEASKQIQLRNYNIYLLQRHFGFQEKHIQSIDYILSASNITAAVAKKILDIDDFIQTKRQLPEKAIKNIPEYVIHALKNEFGKDG
jgi:plasmid replication initiation protein